jgi:hypothetical protein
MSPDAGSGRVCPTCGGRLTHLEGATGTISFCSRCGWKDVQRHNMGRDMMTDNKPILQCSLVAEDVLRGTDPGDPRLSVFGVLRYIFAPRFPALHSRLTVFNVWVGRGEGAFAEQVRILSPDGSEALWEAGTEFELASGVSHQSMSHFRTLWFLTPGDYQVQVLLDEVEMIRYPLTLIHVPGSGDEHEEVQT